MDIYTALNNKVDLLEYEVYVKLNQNQKSAKIISEEVLEKVLELEEAEKQRAFITLVDSLSIATDLLDEPKESDDTLNVIQELQNFFVTNIRHLYFYSVLYSSNVTDPYEKLSYLKSLDETMFLNKTDELLKKYPDTMIKADFKRKNQSTMDPEKYKILKLYKSFKYKNIIISSLFAKEISLLFARTTIEVANYNKIYLFKDIITQETTADFNEESYNIAFISTIEHYRKYKNPKQKSL